ncbi:hypothetical protein M2232_004593 [Bradyrhizobium japonicum]|nr:hypothetical protein [Bradyrhizobium japonicum]MCW2345673.1 hypothetical protein [Bradyrhizobium japonicum]
MAAGNEAGTGVSYPKSISEAPRRQRRQYWHGGIVLALPRARTGLLLLDRPKISEFRFALGLLVQRTRLASHSYGHSRGVHDAEFAVRDAVSGPLCGSSEGGRRAYDATVFPWRPSGACHGSVGDCVWLFCCRPGVRTLDSKQRVLFYLVGGVSNSGQVIRTGAWVCRGSEYCPLSASNIDPAHCSNSKLIQALTAYKAGSMLGAGRGSKAAPIHNLPIGTGRGVHLVRVRNP